MRRILWHFLQPFPMHFHQKGSPCFPNSTWWCWVTAAYWWILLLLWGWHSSKPLGPQKQLFLISHTPLCWHVRDTSLVKIILGKDWPNNGNKILKKWQKGRKFTHVLQSRLWIQYHFLSVQWVRWSTSSCTMCCTAAGWHTCSEGMLSAINRRCMWVLLSWNVLQATSNRQKSVPQDTDTWSAVPRQLSGTIWLSNLVSQVSKQLS